MFSTGSSNVIPFGNRLLTSSILLETTSRCASGRRSGGTCNRKWEIWSTADSKTGTTAGSLFDSEVEGKTPGGSGVDTVERSFDDEKAGVEGEEAMLSRTSTIYCEWGVVSSGTVSFLF